MAGGGGGDNLLLQFCRVGICSCVFILSRAVTGSSFLLMWLLCVSFQRGYLFMFFIIDVKADVCVLSVPHPSSTSSFLAYTPVEGDGRHGVNAGKYGCDGEKVVEAAVA